MRVVSVLVGVLLCVAVALCEGDSNVLVLDSSNFDAAIADNQFILVEFYAPWCGHCKSLAPEYEKAADMLVGKDAVLAKVDATENTELAQQYGVRGYPTLMFFKNGHKLEYGGTRQADGIAEWVLKKSGPAATNLASEEDLNDFLANNAVAVVGFFAADNTENFMAQAGNGDVDTFAFGLVTDADVAASAGVELGNVKLFRDFDDDVTSDSEEIVSFVLANGFPYLEPATQSWGRLRAREVPIALFVFDTEGEDADETLALLQGIAKTNRETYGSAYLGLRYLPNVKDLGVSGETLPTLAIISAAGLNYPFPDETEFNAENVQAFYDGVANGDIAAHFKSEPIPEENDGPVTVIVGDSFKDLVTDSDANVLMEFYAPWCGHCKSLAPTYEELGEHYSDNDNVVIAKMDSTANDNGAVQIRGFPTIYWFPAGAKDSPVEYQGGRDLASFVSFIDEQIGSGTAEEDEHAGHDHEHNL